MTDAAPPDAPEAAPSLSTRLGEVLNGPAPLPLKDILKGLPKPPKEPKPRRKKGEPAPQAVDLGSEVGKLLDDEYHVGRAFRYPSGAKGVERYWARDEKQLLRDAALEAAAEPQPLPALLKALKGVVNGTDNGFAEAVVRDLIGEDRLYEHPPKTKKGGPLFARVPPRPPTPPLELPKARKELDKLAKSAAKLLTSAGVSADTLLAALRHLLAGKEDEEERKDESPAAAPDAGDGPELDEHILRAVAHAGPGSVLSLADLRRQMPAESRGPAFDVAVLRLADAGRVQVFQDSDPFQFPEEERAGFVTDARGHTYTNIGKRG